VRKIKNHKLEGDLRLVVEPDELSRTPFDRTLGAWKYAPIRRNKAQPAEAGLRASRARAPVLLPVLTNSRTCGWRLASISVGERIRKNRQGGD
jgi:hypothetical protein